jgi:phospholipid/cholesterol/gamma-HCH transport system substrate-binding protein
MDERVVEFRFGVMVVAVIITTVILALLFGETPSWFRGGTYTVYIRFPDAPGVTKGTPIRKSGILIGQVSDVSFADDNDGVVITAEIDSGRKIPRNDVCRITTSLLGDATLEFVSPRKWNEPGKQEPTGEISPQAATGAPPAVLPVSDAQPAAPPGGAPPAGEDGARRFLQAGDVIRGIVSPDASQVVANLQGDLAKVIDSVAKTSDDLGGLVRQVRGLLGNNEERINRILVQTDETTAMFNETLKSINLIVGDAQTREQLRAAINQAPQLLSDTREAVNKMGQTMTLIDRNLENIAGFTEPLGQNGPTLVSNLNKSADKLDKVLGQLMVFSESLNSPKGTLGRLINDPDLYDSISRSVANIEDLTYKLRPIVDDARVFSDKIARHPEVLGVRGAIQKNPGIK